MNKRVVGVVAAAVAVLGLFLPVVSGSGGGLDITMSIGQIGGLAYALFLVVPVVSALTVANKVKNGDLKMWCAGVAGAGLALTGFVTLQSISATKALLQMTAQRGAGLQKMLAGLGQATEVAPVSVSVGAGAVVIMACLAVVLFTAITDRSDGGAK